MQQPASGITERGQEIIDEAATLLRRIEFSSNSAAFLEGRHVAVEVHPWWNEDMETLLVVVSCHAFHHRHVDWAGLPLFVSKLGDKGVRWLAFLDARGCALFENLPPGEYKLSASSLHGRSTRTIPLPIRSLAMAAASDSATKETVSLDSGIYETSDGRVRATVRQAETGETVLAFETNDEALAGATVRFVFAAKSGSVERGAEVRLEPVKGAEGLWEGRWEELVEVTEPCELSFWVLPEEL